MARLLLLSTLLAFSAFLFLQDALLWQGLGTLMACLTVLWLLSLVLRDSSIVDIFWGFGFVILVWFYGIKLNFSDIRSQVFVGLVSLWGLRLTLYLAWRNIGKGEDYRYQAWRQQHGQHWWWVSYLRVFVLQGLILWVVASPLWATLQAPQPWRWSDWLGLGLWAIGLFFETVGDWQLARFKASPTNQGQVMNQGLWGLTRHPNYFGDAVVWWGFFMFAWDVSGGIFIVSPLLMTFLLMRVSGVALLEKTLRETKPQYAEYEKNVPAFFPKWRSKKNDLR
jgi:steroid 5-alpha reductase family enzyme